MKTIEKIEKKGYRVISNLGYKNDVKCIVSYTAICNNLKITKPNLTQLYNSINF